MPEYPAKTGGLPQDHLAVCPLRDLPPDRKRAFYAWIEAMTRESDNEDGPGFAAWMRHHEAVAGDTTWVFTDGNTGDLLGTASLVKRDHGTEADEGGWVLGGVNVVGDRRHQGIGSAIMRFVEAELVCRAREAGRPVPVKLKATYAPAIRLYEAFGYRRAAESTDLFERVYEVI
jgi:GNAT superfamily N-acetyltransferase